MPLTPSLYDEEVELASKRILIVDDIHTNRLILSMQTKSWKMEPTEAESAEEAMAILRQGPAFDIAIFDMLMPYTDGLELARTVRSELSDLKLPLILYTSLGEYQTIEEGVFQAVLNKPIKPNALKSVMLKVLRKETVQNDESRDRRKIFDATFAERHPLQILVAEDNQINQKVVVQMLKKLGYRADVAGNGREAIEAVQRQTYDVILMDVQMPEMNGLDATRYINARFRGKYLPWIIGLTANAMQSDKKDCFDAGMNDYLTKPLTVDLLTAGLAQAHEKHVKTHAT